MILLRISFMLLIIGLGMLIGGIIAYCNNPTSIAETTFIVGGLLFGPGLGAYPILAGHYGRIF